MDEIQRMQEYLPMIRNSLGWSGARLGNELDLSRQAVSMVERKRVNLTRTMYYALLYVFKREIEKNDNRLITKLLLRHFVEEQSCLLCDEKEKVISDLKFLLVPGVIRSEADIVKLSNAFEVMAKVGGYAHLLKD